MKDYRNGGVGQSPEMNYIDERMRLAAGTREEIAPPYVTCSYCGKRVPVIFSGAAASALHREVCPDYLAAERAARGLE